MKTIIIVSHDKDLHASYLIEKANSLGIKNVLLDTGSYPKGAEISISFFGGKKRLSLKHHNKLISSDDISGVWWRRPLGSKNEEKQSKIDKYMKLEGEVVIRSLADFLPNINWVSDPNATRLACRKPIQLAIARQTGFKIPETCISNSDDEVATFLDFLQKNNKELTIKPVGSAFIELSEEGDQDKVVFTKKISPVVILDNLRAIKNCPVIFQEAINKDFDIRATVVDNEVFATKISLDGCKEEDNLDWRNYAGTRRYEKYQLPDEISQICINFTKSMGLIFGCIDLAFSKKEGYTFFEINPQGQWLPSELQLGYPIASRLIKSLVM
ncbi:hypothetical protein L6261_00180 [Candidatus Parcubacteria bacterium]|nr:hypothetical protein [Candidatus Parcubacteria bacterium]